MNVLIKREYDYAIRICAYLAGMKSGKTISVSNLAEKLFITRPFATKIVHKLKNQNIVGTIQGKNGGIFLQVSPKTLSVYDVLMAMGYDSTLNECLKNPQICPLIGFCSIHQFFLEMEKEMINGFKQKSIADFAFTDDDLQSKVNKSL